MGKKDWNDINRANAKKLRELLSPEQIHFLGGIYEAISLRRQSGLDHGDLIDQAKEHLPKNFDNTRYWIKLSYQMSQGMYGGIGAEERRHSSNDINHLDESEQAKAFLRIYGGNIDSWGGLEEVLKFANGN